MHLSKQVVGMITGKGREDEPLPHLSLAKRDLIHSGTGYQRLPGVLFQGSLSFQTEKSKKMELFLF